MLPNLVSKLKCGNLGDNNLLLDIILFSQIDDINISRLNRDYHLEC